MKRIITILFTIVVCLFLNSCKSAEDYYREGQSAEANGQVFRAGDLYVRSLGRQATFQPARQSLEAIATRAENEAVRQANNSSQRGQALAAVSNLQSFEAFKGRVAGVGIRISLSPTYASFKRQKLDGAINYLFQDSDAQYAQQNWGSALSALDKISQYRPSQSQSHQVTDKRRLISNQAYSSYLQTARESAKKNDFATAYKMIDAAKGFASTDQQRQEIANLNREFKAQAFSALMIDFDQEIQKKKFANAEKMLSEIRKTAGKADGKNAETRLYLAWANDEMIQRHYRHAYQKAEQLIKLQGHNAQALSIQNNALRQGSSKVIFLPVLKGTTNVSNAVMDDLNFLVKEKLRQPRPFMSVVNQDTVVRTLRQFNLHRHIPNNAELARVGRHLGADYVVILEFDRYVFTEKYIKSTQHTLQMTNNQPITFTERKGKLLLDLSLSMELLEVVNSKVQNRAAVKANKTEAFHDATLPAGTRESKVRLSRHQKSLLSQHSHTRQKNSLNDKALAHIAKALVEATHQKLMETLP